MKYKKYRRKIGGKFFGLKDGINKLPKDIWDIRRLLFRFS